MLPALPASTVLLNAYYLQEEAARGVLNPGSRGLEHVREVMQKAQQLGVTLIRSNAFNDGDNTARIQISPLQFSESALVGLDHVLHLAHEHHVRLVLSLGNYWDDYGGTRQYVAWAGFSNARQGDARFFRERAVIEHYKSYIDTILNRINTLDGIRYGDHPAVFSWELLNEARGDGLSRDGTEMRAWIDELGAHIRARTGHTIGTGEEGFDVSYAGYTESYWRRVASDHFSSSHGTSFALNTASPFIDYASVHLYPDRWSRDARIVEEAARAYVEQHAHLAETLGKPTIVGEFGLARDSFDLPTRQRIYRSLLTCGGSTRIAALGLWLFHYDERSESFDAHAFYFRDGTDPWATENLYAGLVREFANGLMPMSP